MSDFYDETSEQFGCILMQSNTANMDVVCYLDGNDYVKLCLVDDNQDHLPHTPMLFFRHLESCFQYIERHTMGYHSKRAMLNLLSAMQQDAELSIIALQLGRFTEVSC